MDINIVDDTASLMKLRNDWIDLCLRAPHHYFQTYDWLQAWWIHVGSQSDIKMRVLVGRESNKVVFIWPLVIVRHYLWHVLRWMADDVSDYCDVLIDRDVSKDKWFNKSWDILTSLRGVDAIRLNHVKANSQVRPLLDRMHCKAFSTNTAPYIALENWNNWEEYFGTVKKNLQVKTQARVLRRLKEKGALSFTVLTNEQRLEDITNILITQKTRRFEEKGQSGAIDKEGYVGFLLSVVKNAFSKKKLHLSILSVDNDVIAIHLGWIYHKHLYYYFPTFDLSYKRYSPGRILLEELLKWSFENKLKVFDFMVGDEPYKYNWTDSDIKIYSYASQHNIWGKIYFKWVSGSIKPSMKAVYNSMPNVIRRRIGVFIKK